MRPDLAQGDATEANARSCEVEGSVVGDRKLAPQNELWNFQTLRERPLP